MKSTEYISENVLSQRLRKCRPELISYNTNNINCALLSVNENGIVQSIRRTHNPTVQWKNIDPEERLIFDTAVDSAVFGPVFKVTRKYKNITVQLQGATPDMQSATKTHV